MKKYYIYKHTCNVNGKSYVGQTQQKPAKRWKANGRGYEYQELFYRAIKKYGWENFSHEILEEVNSLEEANKREQYWIAYYHTYVDDPECNGYNLTAGGDSKDVSIIARQKISLKAFKRKVICIETQEIFDSVNTACTIMKNKHIANCLSKQRYTANGYHWAYLDDVTRQEELKGFIGKNPISLKEQGLSKRARSIICIETGEEFPTMKSALKQYGNSVRAALAKKCELAYGYHWVFKDDLELFNKLKHLYKSNVKHKTMSEKQPVICVETGEEFSSTNEAMKAYGPGIHPVLKNKKGHITAYGYHWKYKEVK